MNVASTGSYTAEVRVASNGSGGTFHIEFDGMDRTGLLTAPNTGAWESWTTVRKTGVLLEAGPHVMRLVLDNVGPSGSVANLNWVRFTAQ